MRRSTQRRFAGLLALILVVAACGGSASPTPSATTAAPTAATSPAGSTTPTASGSAAPTAGPTTPAAPFPNQPITLSWWVTADGSSKASAEKIAASYKLIHPNVTINVQEFPFLDLHQKLQIALQAGTGAPDIAWAEISRFGSLLKGNNGLVDLTDLMKPYLSEFIPAREANYTYQGRIYGIDNTVCETVLYYRNDLLQQAGITTPITTWDQYIAAGQQLKQKTSKYMMAIETSDYDVWTPIMLQYGGDFFDQSGQVVIDSPQNHKALQFLSDLVTKYGIAIPAPGGDQYNPTFWGAYQKGDVASMWGADWMSGVIESSVPSLSGKWRAQPMPTSADAPSPVTTVGGTAFVISKQSQYQTVDWDFIQYAFINKQPTSTAPISSNTAWWSLPLYHQPDPYFGGQKIAELWISQATALFKPNAPFLIANPNDPTAYDIFVRDALGPVINGQKSVDQGLADAAAELKSAVGP